MDGPDNTMYYHDKRKPKLVKNVRQGGGKSIMVWVAFTYGAKLPMAEMYGSQNSKDYQKLLKIIYFLSLKRMKALTMCFSRMEQVSIGLSQRKTGSTRKKLM